MGIPFEAARLHDDCVGNTRGEQWDGAKSLEE